MRGFSRGSSGGCSAAACAVRLERPSLDGRNHLALEIRADPRATRMQMGRRTVSFEARVGWRRFV